ncbi:MAG: dATP/dGTP diphosphohydrolase domain-containing protein, partial [Candidatus Heimdallarchaeaceae archaeon]
MGAPSRIKEAEKHFKKYITKDSGTRQKFDSGAVRDIQQGKGRFDLLPATAIKMVADVFERGAIKYGDRNWEKGIPLSRYIDSALRHT